MGWISDTWLKWSDGMPYIERNHEGYRDPTASVAMNHIEQEERTQRLGFRPLPYICSPYAGDVEHNVQNARHYCAFAVARRALPIAPHLLFPQFMGEETPESRELALHMGLILLCHCKEVWYFGPTITEGMKQELNKARLRGIPVRHFTDDYKEVPI